MIINPILKPANDNFFTHYILLIYQSIAEWEFTNIQSNTIFSYLHWMTT